MPWASPKIYLALPSRKRRSARLRLMIVPLIDVVFLLLVFFLATANFRSREAFLPAQLPRQSDRAEQMELEPLLVYLSPLPDGACQVRIGAAADMVISPSPGGADFADLTRRISEILRNQGRTLDDPVKLVPARAARWDQVVKTYDALWRLNLTNIIFTFVDE